MVFVPKYHVLEIDDFGVAYRSLFSISWLFSDHIVHALRLMIRELSFLNGISFNVFIIDYLNINRIKPL